MEVKPCGCETTHDCKEGKADAMVGQLSSTFQLNRWNSKVRTDRVCTCDKQVAASAFDPRASSLHHDTMETPFQHVRVFLSKFNTLNVTARCCIGKSSGDPLAPLDMTSYEHKTESKTLFPGVAVVTGVAGTSTHPLPKEI